MAITQPIFKPEPPDFVCQQIKIIPTDVGDDYDDDDNDDDDDENPQWP